MARTVPHDAQFIKRRRDDDLPASVGRLGHAAGGIVDIGAGPAIGRDLLDHVAEAVVDEARRKRDRVGVAGEIVAGVVGEAGGARIRRDGRTTRSSASKAALVARPAKGQKD